MTFTDRTEAGHRLASLLAGRVWHEPPTVLALGPGGAPIAFEIARVLHAELDLFQVRPFSAGAGNQELGAVASGGVRVIHAKLRDDLGVSDDEIRQVTDRVADEIQRSEQGWRSRHPRTDLTNHVVLLVDDHIGPDTRMDAAVMVAKVMGARRVIAVAPIGMRGTLEQVGADANEVVCLVEVADAAGLDAAYAALELPDDTALRDLLERAEEWRAPMVVVEEH
jgi:putative phosphoribosyl transferase